jgi:hypothetical protein
LRILARNSQQFSIVLKVPLRGDVGWHLYDPNINSTDERSLGYVEKSAIRKDVPFRIASVINKSPSTVPFFERAFNQLAKLIGIQ